MKAFVLTVQVQRVPHPDKDRIQQHAHRNKKQHGKGIAVRGKRVEAERTQPVDQGAVEEMNKDLSHLMKIVQQLSAQGLLETTRGRGGGMRLMVPASSIHIGAVVRATETDFNLVECFDPASNQCRLSSHCRLQSVLGQAMQSFFAVLDALTLEDLMVPAGQAASSTGVIPIALVPGLPRPVN